MKYGVPLIIYKYQKEWSDKNIEHLRNGEDFPDIPLILITHSSPLAIGESMKFGNNTRAFAESVEEMWQSIMKEYLKFSRKSLWIQATNSTHYIHLTEPEIVINAVSKKFGNLQN